jgi:hypothetical protein
MDIVRTEVSEELFASIIWVTRISELRTTLAVSSNRSMLIADSCFPDDGGDHFFRSVDFHKCHMA